MTQLKKKSIKLPNTAYEIYQNHQKQIHYPLMLSTFLLTSKSQFQFNRAVRLMCDWLQDYKVMNQIVKHKFVNQIPKVLKNILSLYSSQADIYVCLAPYYYQFYTQWKDLTDLIALNLVEGKKYALKFLWYLSFDFCEKLDAERQYQFNIYLSQNFQQPLLQFSNPDEMTFKPLLQTVRMINIQKAKNEFVENAELWAQKMIKLFEVCTVQSLKIEVLIEIIGCRVFLLPKPVTAEFWISMVDLFFSQIQKRLPNFYLTNQVDLKLLDWMSVILHFDQIKSYLMRNKKRFLSSLISKMKNNPDPKNAFHYEKYYSMRNTLIDLFFFKNKQESIKEIEEILTQFNKKSLSVLKESPQNILLFDCMCENKLPITKANINEIIKSLANGHSRKSFPVQVLIILVKVLHSASEQTLTEQSINSVIKSLSECIASKINDPNIIDLRLEISKFYITLAQKYMWNDQKSTEIMLLWSEQFQRNNKMSTPQTIVLLKILTKKHKSVVNASFGHKLEALITDITYKLKYNKVYNNIPLFVSLLLTLYLNIEWKQSHKFVAEICTDNPQDVTFLYLLQSQILIREKSDQKVKLQQKEIIQIKYIIQNKEMWRKPSRINVYLYCIEMFFSKISKEEALIVLKQLDQTLRKLFGQMFDEGMYHQMIHLAARIFFRIGSLSLLKSMKSYLFFKSVSFEILSKSFHKHTIVLMSYAYCLFMNRADNIETFFLELNDEKFLNSLFQGCDQFIGKSPKFYQEYCYVILMAIKARESVNICGHSSLIMLKEIQKNVVWWQEAKFWVSFKLPQEEESQGSALLIEEFKQYYEEEVRKYFSEEVNLHFHNKTRPKQKDINEGDDDNYDL